MTQFRPCIDLHDGQVKQIVGGTLSDHGPGPETNFTSERDASDFAAQYRDDQVGGAHVIKLGPGNDQAARRALAAWPNGLQLGGGITVANAAEWISAGASHVIVTSWLFVEGHLDHGRVRELAQEIGPQRLVIDLSCRRRGDAWYVATDRWQTVTDTAVDATLLESLGSSCAEFLIHAADVEGKQAGIDDDLVRVLGAWAPLPTTYAGGARSLDDLHRVADLSDGKVDLTIGSALDIFGGPLAYADCVAWNRRQ